MAVSARRWLAKAAPYVVSLALLGTLATFVDIKGLVHLVRLANWHTLLVGAAVFVVTVALRGLRFAMVLPSVAGGSVTFTGGLELATVSNIANHLLPFRLGEVVFVFLATFGHRAPADRAALALLLVRLYDLLAALVLVAIAVATYAASTVWPYALGAAAVLVLLVALRLDWVVPFGTRIARWLFGWGPLARSRAVVRVLTLLARLERNLDALRRPRLVALNLALAFSIWLCLFATFAVLLDAFGLQRPFVEVVVGGAATGLTALLPLNGVGSIGTLEAGWTVGFVATGMRASDAVASGLAMHGIVIVVSALLAAPFLSRLGNSSWRGFREWRQNNTVARAAPTEPA